MTLHNKVLTALLLTSTAFCAQAAEPADKAQVRSLAASCANCHGTAGVAQPGMESLAGQSKEDLLKKMMDFKSGKKPATLMHQLAKGYTDPELEQLAAYFAALKK